MTVPSGSWKPAGRRGATRPMVGRHHEWAVVCAAASKSAAAGRGLLLCVTGEPGLGKTTLVESFLDELAASGRPYGLARGRCSERLAGTEAYLPFLEALDSLITGRRRCGRGTGDEAAGPHLVRAIGAAGCGGSVPGPRARGGQGGLAGAPETRTRRVPSRSCRAAAPWSCSWTTFTGPTHRVSICLAYLGRQVRGVACAAGAHLPPVGPAAEPAPFWAGQAGTPGAGRLPRDRLAVLEPGRPRPLPGAGLCRAPSSRKISRPSSMPGPRAIRSSWSICSATCATAE